MLHHSLHFERMDESNHKTLTLPAIADEETTVLDIFDTSFMLKLFETEPLLAATFYKHIAISLANRLKNGAHSLLSTELPQTSYPTSRFSFTNSPEISGSADINCSLNENAFRESLTTKYSTLNQPHPVPRQLICSTLTNQP
eukprot:TRINITY_DN10274_c0_g1_i1.p1 TRINITY_DN10274_c0_g1~~TRINITY_DN10274_c0_g1_i1.p1  ORF type:complete len:142 (-),score=23.03 TRINITY_DN10274_c0_g1_i1:90-515(-)